MKPKLEDVAKRANVSKTTVSRVLNNRGYLSQETINKVNKAIKELNYQPNVVARQLFNKKTNIIGLIFPTVSNPFFGELVAALEKELYLSGYQVLIGNSMNDSQKEAYYLNQLLSEQVDGLIVGTHNQGITEYKHSNLPIVSIDVFMNDDIPVIESDNYEGGRLATEFLINLGAKKIIHTNGPISLDTPAQRRRESYETTMLQNNLKPIVIEIDFNIPNHEKRQIFENLFIEHPDVEAIFASNDVDAALIRQIAQNKNKKIPDDILIVGYDGTDIMVNLFPEMPTIIQPIDDMAKKSVEILKKRIEQKKTEKEYILPVTIYEGL